MQDSFQQLFVSNGQMTFPSLFYTFWPLVMQSLVSSSNRRISFGTGGEFGKDSRHVALVSYESRAPVPREEKRKRRLTGALTFQAGALLIYYGILLLLLQLDCQTVFMSTP